MLFPETKKHRVLLVNFSEEAALGQVPRFVLLVIPLQTRNAHYREKIPFVNTKLPCNESFLSACERVCCAEPLALVATMRFARNTDPHGRHGITHDHLRAKLHGHH